MDGTHLSLSDEEIGKISQNRPQNFKVSNKGDCDYCCMIFNKKTSNLKLHLSSCEVYKDVISSGHFYKKRQNRNKEVIDTNGEKDLKKKKKIEGLIKQVVYQYNPTTSGIEALRVTTKNRTSTRIIINY